MQKIGSDDAEIFYDVAGAGPPVILLHPFPAHHEFWLPLAEYLSSRYQLIMPDLRGHGESGLGNGPATMQKHASDVAHVMTDAGIDRAPLIGVSIGGYTIFEFWRAFRDRVSALVLCNTKAGADTAEARAARLKAANDVLQEGTEPFFESMLQKVLAESTRHSRPDLVEGALRMMRKMSAEDVAGVQRGMAERPDSVSTLKTINAPVLVITGDEDNMTGVPEAELMKQNIAGSQMKVIAKAGHYLPWEQPQEAGKLMRQFLDSVMRG
jgi:pimeloyl-ACP methyl ester carboxylesterase